MSISYSYRAKPTTMALAGLFFGACGAFFVYRFATNDRGLIINGVFELGPRGATVFYAVLGVVSLLFVLAAIAAMILGNAKGSRIILAEDHMIVPAGVLRRQPRMIPFSAITRTAIQEVSGQRFFTVWSKQGKVSIARSMLESDAVFDEIRLFISDRTPP